MRGLPRGWSVFWDVIRCGTRVESASESLSWLNPWALLSKVWTATSGFMQEEDRKPWCQGNHHAGAHRSSQASGDRDSRQMPRVSGHVAGSGVSGGRCFGFWDVQGEPTSWWSWIEPTSDVSTVSAKISTVWENFQGTLGSVCQGSGSWGLQVWCIWERWLRNAYC